MNDTNETSTENSLVEFVCTNRNLCFDDEQYRRADEAIRQRMSQLEISTKDDYRDHLQAHPQEYSNFLDLYFREKGFLIEEPIWTQFYALFANRFSDRSKRPLRVWVVGCGRGGEAFGVAIALAEILGTNSGAIKIFATDTDDTKIAAGRQSILSGIDLKDHLSNTAAAKYFTRVGEVFTFSPALRKSIVFGKHDVSRDQPICKMDLIICRQIVSYLNADLQEWVGKRLMHALNEQGILMLDQCERLPESVQASNVVNLPFVYQKKLFRSSSTSKTEPVGEQTAAIKLIDAVGDATPIATVTVDVKGFVISVNAEARKAFNLNHQDVGKTLQDLELSYRPVELRSLVELAYKENRQVVIQRVGRSMGKGEIQLFDLYVTPLSSGLEKLGVNIEFHETTEMYNLRDELVSLNQQLQTANEELQSSHEELETTNEELHSTNEELETTNEELQATNEELETMNEELLSTNTELEFSNSGQRELATAVDTVNAFLESILSSIWSAIVVIDAEYKVQVWNQRSADLWGLRLDEVRGQDIFQLDIGFPLDTLREPLKNIERGSALEKYDAPAINRRGQSIACSNRVMPLADTNGYIILIDEE